MDHVFSSIRQQVVVGRFQVMETAAPWKPWKTNRMFSTVPTALGKLGTRRRVSHSSHNLYRWKY
jgi:hypothetical protein